MSRIVLTAVGSGGDVFPFVPIAHELRRRGHDVTLAVPPPIAHSLRSEDLDVVAIGPFQGRAAAQRHNAFDHRLRGYAGLDRFFGMLVDALPRTVEDLRPLLRTADLAVAHVFHPAARIATELEGRPVAVLDLHPCFRPTRHAPPPGLPRFGRWGNRAMWALLRAAARRRVDRPVNDERRRAGLASVHDLVVEGGRAADLCLDLSDPAITPRQPDWTVPSVAVGYPYWDSPTTRQPEADDELETMLTASPAPVVFTLGTALPLDPGSFYEVALGAAALLPNPSILLGAARFAVPAELAGRVLVRGYEPLSRLLPRAAAVVHHGGAGTTYAGLLHGCPAVVVPRCYDQAFQASRVEALGAGVVLPWRQLSVDRMRSAVRRVVERPEHRTAAQRVATDLASADPPATRAADHLEAWLAR
jgi:UDP:flavonoid glycosyltransferase YjiC (YdhE family)